MKITDEIPIKDAPYENMKAFAILSIIPFGFVFLGKLKVQALANDDSLLPTTGKMKQGKNIFAITALTIVCIISLICGFFLPYTNTAHEYVWQGEHTIKVGEQYLIKFRDGHKAEIKFWSENPEIATVDEAGYVTGIHSGKVKIGYSMNGYKASARFTVKNKKKSNKNKKKSVKKKKSSKKGRKK